MDPLAHRPLFSDGWNSFCHVLFGAVGAFWAPTSFLFTAYQFMNWDNLLIDMGEYGVGLIVTRMIFKK